VSPPTDEKPRSAYNAEIVIAWSDSRWSSWFRAVCDDVEKRDSHPLRLHPEARLADDVEAVYVRLPEGSRYAMRIGLAQAIGSWNPVHYSYNVLSRFCWIAAQIRASETIPALLQILMDYRQSVLAGDDATIGIADDLISILAGFVPDPEGRLEAMFIDLLFDDKVAPQLTSTLAVAISSWRHDYFARSFNRFFAMRRRAPEGFFCDEEIVAAFAQAVPRQEIERGVEGLTGAAYEYLMRVGVAAKVFPAAALMGTNGEAHLNGPDNVLPFVKSSDQIEQAGARYAIAVAARQSQCATAENLEFAAGSKRSSTLDTVYAKVKQGDEDDPAA
jgi:hypothetical protein